MRLSETLRIRVDDYPYANPEGRDQLDSALGGRIAVYTRLFEIFESARVPYLLGVVPTFIDETDIAFLQSLAFARVALHGYDHAFKTAHRDEFRSDSVRGIATKLEDGLHLLGRIAPALRHCGWYIPTFDTVTQPLVNALTATGFRHMTARPDWDGRDPGGNLVDTTGIEVHVAQKAYEGRSYQILPRLAGFGPKDHIVLHATWEAFPLIERGRPHAGLAQLLASIAAVDGR